MKPQKLTKRLIVGMLILSCTGTTFAQDTNLTKDTVDILYNIVLFLSRSWSVFAMIAGKLMTNDMVLGGVFHLDVYLRKIRNVMKNFANFALGLFFLYFVLKSLISGKDDAKALIVTKIKGFILAGILIQASWFLVVATIDIATILTTSFGSLPSIFIAENSEFANQLKEAGSNLTHHKRYIFESNETTKQRDITIETGTQFEDMSDEAMFDFIMPSNKTLSGPLLFLGTSIFSFQDTTLYDYNTINSSGGALIVLLMNFGITVMYAIALLLLVIVNVVRVGFIRLLIAAGPIFALLRGLKWGGVLEKDPLDSKIFSPNTLFELIFIPVRVVVFLSLILIFAVMMWKLMTSPNELSNTLRDNYETQVHNTVTGSVLVVNNVTEQTVQGDIFKDIKSTTQNSIADLIVFIFTLVLIRMLIKLSFPSENAITGKITEGFFRQAERLIASTPFIPIPGGGKMALGDAERIFNKAKGDYLYETFGTRQLDQLDIYGKDQFDRNIEAALGQKQTSLSSLQRKELDIAVRRQRDPVSFIQLIGQYAPKLQRGFSLTDATRKEYVYKWLKNNKNRGDDMVKLGFTNFKAGQITNDVDETLENFFNAGGHALQFQSLLADQGLYEYNGLKVRQTDNNKYDELKKMSFRGNQIADDEKTEEDDTNSQADGSEETQKKEGTK